jgi:acyl-CoA thioester hydrolase
MTDDGKSPDRNLSTVPAHAHCYEVLVGASSIDANGHANNIEFVRWMQEAAIAHADIRGCSAFTKEVGAAWVVHTHHIEYLRPAFLGDQIQVMTWLANLRRAFSLRKYEFVRVPDKLVLARGETDWVFVDARSGRPRSIPDPIKLMFAPPDAGPPDQKST